MGPLGKPGAKRWKILFLSVSDTETQHDWFMSINDNCSSYNDSCSSYKDSWLTVLVSTRRSGNEHERTCTMVFDRRGEPTIAKLGLTLGFSEDNFTDSTWGRGGTLL